MHADPPQLPCPGGQQSPPVASQIKPPPQTRPAVQVRHCPGVVLHWPLWQAVGAGGGVQSPRELQTDAAVRLPPVQLAGTQVTVLAG
jgi:hypothetical protein